MAKFSIGSSTTAPKEDFTITIKNEPSNNRSQPFLKNTAGATFSIAEPENRLNPWTKEDSGRLETIGKNAESALGINTQTTTPASPEAIKESLTQEGYDEKYGSYNYEFDLDSGVCYVDGQKVELSPEAKDYLDKSKEYVGGINSYVEKNGDLKFDGINIDARSTKAGEKLAEAAKTVAEQMDTVGYCYTGVAKSTDQAGLPLGLEGCSAYMAAEPNQLPSTCTDITSQFGGKAYNLRAAPRGAIVVWPKAEASPHGHISVSLGNGIEASDHIAPQMTNYRGNTTDFKVFMPKDGIMQKPK